MLIVYLFYADLAHTILTKCVSPEGNIRSDSFQLKLDFGFIQDMEDTRKTTKKLSLSSAMCTASSNLLDPRERLNVGLYTDVHIHIYICYSTRWPPSIYKKNNHVLAIMASRMYIILMDLNDCSYIYTYICIMVLPNLTSG